MWINGRQVQIEAHPLGHYTDILHDQVINISS